MNRTALKIGLFAVAAICISFGAYRVYGWDAVPISMTIVGLAAWANLRERK